jgi:membrane fusion protein (multidrug efflux system)
VIVCIQPAGFVGLTHAQQAPVATATSETMKIPHLVRLSGTVVSPRTADVSTELGGIVQELRVDLGDRVEAGQTLVQLDAALERLDLRRAEAATQEARKTLAEVNRELAVGRQLAANNNLPQNELDAREAQVRIAQAALDRLEAEAARYRARVERHTIRAPFAGVVAERVAAEGEWVAPGAAVVELVETDRLFVDVPVPQDYFSELRSSPEVTVQFDAFPGRPFAAEVAARVPVSDPTVRTFTLRLRPRVGDVALTPGMSARVTLGLASDERGVAVPRDAVIRYPDGRTTVWIAEQAGDATTVAERQVELGRAFEDRVHVRSGLRPGETIVVRGNEALREGQQVTLANSQS